MRISYSILESRHANFFQKRQTVSKDLFTFIFHGKNRKKTVKKLLSKASKSVCRSLSKFGTWKIFNFFLSISKTIWNAKKSNKIFGPPYTPPLTLSIFLDFMEDNGRKWKSKLVIFVGFIWEICLPLACQILSNHKLDMCQSILILTK